MITLGPIRELEDALFARIEALKADDPLRPIAVVTASNHQLKYLQEQTARRDLTLFHMHWLTFFGLARTLTSEQPPEGTFEPHGVFYEELAEAAVKRTAESSDRLARMVGFSGLSAGLKGSFQDLREAEVDAAVLYEAVQDNLFEGIQTGVLNEVALGYRLFTELARTFNVYDATDLTLAAVEAASEHPFLEKTAILYYGFYDLTGVQMQFMKAVWQAGESVEAFLPIRAGHRAYQFATPFHDEFLQSLSSDIRHLTPATRTLDRFATELFNPEGETALWSRKAAVDILSATGTRNECRLAALTILEKNDQGVAFGDMDIVVRTHSGYAADLSAELTARGIPFCSNASMPAVRHPWVKLVRVLSSLDTAQLDRGGVMELLTSPAFPKPEDASPEIWNAASRQIALGGSLHDWQRKLTPWLERELRLAQTIDEEDDGLRMATSDTRQFLDALELLADHLPDHRTEASWEEHTRQMEALVDALIPTENEDLRGLLDGIFRELNSVARIYGSATPSWTEWAKVFQRLVDRAEIPAAPRDRKGVRVLDAMEARGTRNAVRIVLGLNERVFPRQVREDSFLKDSARAAIHNGLGNPVPAKIRGFDEERLIYHLVVSGAEQGLVLIYQRTDQEGRVLAPSLYLRESVNTAYGMTDPTEAPGYQAFPRRILEQIDKRPPAHLVPAEAMLRTILVNQDASAVWSAYGREGGVWTERIAAMDALGQWSGFGACDGDVASAAVDLTDETISPSAIKSLARCPFQYFARKRLRVTPLPDPEQDDALGALDIGTLYHDALEILFRSVKTDGFLKGKAMESAVEHAVDQAVHRYEMANPVGYPLELEILRRQMLYDLEVVLRYEQDRLQNLSLTPELLEETLTGQIMDSDGNVLLQTLGKVDRIDADNERFAIVDYKTGRVPDHAEFAKGWGDLVQIALYLDLARQRLAEHGVDNATAIDGRLLYIRGLDEEPESRVIPAEFWEKNRDTFEENFHAMNELLREGRYPIVAGRHCEYCDIAPMCRKEHPPSRRRAEEEGLLTEWHESRKVKWDV
jgi:ATP-dependent helicase/DNAse subunit B